MYCFIILLHLISSFSLTRYLLLSYAYVSIKSIDRVLLSSFEVNVMLLVSSVKTWCFSLSILCCVFNLDLLFLMNSLWFFLGLSMLIFFLDILLYYQLELLSNNFYNFPILFMAHFFVPFGFLSLLQSSIK